MRRRCGQVRLQDESQWRFEYPCLTAARFITYLGLNNPRTVNHVILDALQINARRRRLNKNQLFTEDGTGLRAIGDALGVNRGLAMELLTAATLTCIDNPVFVQSWCHLAQPGVPHSFALGGNADVGASYGGAFNIIAEVSARQKPVPADFATQLSQAIKHRVLEGESDKGVPTYALVITESNIETDKNCLACYRDAVLRAREEDAELRLIPIWLGHWADFAATLIQAVDTEERSFGRDAFRALLDELHVGLSATGHDPEIGWTRRRLMAAAGRERELPLPPQTAADDLPDHQ